MILRIWLILGTLIVVAAWVLTVPLSPPPRQASPGSFTDAYRKTALLPGAGALQLSEEIGHEVFEVPDTDAAHLAAAMAAGNAGMAGMATGEHGTMSGMAGSAPAAPGSAAPSPPAMEKGQQMPAGPPPAAMPGMSSGEHGAIPGMAAHEPGAMPGMVMGREESEEAHVGGYGLALVPAAMTGMAARTVEVEMREWGFEPAAVEVTAGEVIRFVVRNRGHLPHEFMFMPGAAMQALDYRLERADWSLTEHEAIFEQEVILPGDALAVTVRVEQPGSWMFMCMFPYHMQFGMMGMMATRGAAMPGMHKMGGMKM